MEYDLTLGSVPDRAPDRTVLRVDGAIRHCTYNNKTVRKLNGAI